MSSLHPLSSLPTPVRILLPSPSSQLRNSPKSSSHPWNAAENSQCSFFFALAEVDSPSFYSSWVIFASSRRRRRAVSLLR